MNINDIPIAVLYAVRQRMGAKDEHDTSVDEKIECMIPRELIARYTGWELGDEQWGYTILDLYEDMKRAESKPSERVA